MKSIGWAGVLVCVCVIGCESPKPLEPATSVETPNVEPEPEIETVETPQESAEISTQAQLEAALRDANPEFEGQVGAKVEPRGITAIELRDPTIEDIGPLKGLPLFGVDLSGTRVRDLEPLRGMQLTHLYLEDTRVEKIDVLKGMPLVELYLSDTDVKDIGPIANAPLIQLNLKGTGVTDLRPLAGLQNLDMLWLNDTPVSDIRPLAKARAMVSLTLAGTKVSDLSPLKGHSLKRLHIGRTPVTDLSALEWMQLKRLVFTPGRITQGIEAARNMPSINQIGTQFGEPPAIDDLEPPSRFWPRYDAGQFD